MKGLLLLLSFLWLSNLSGQVVVQVLTDKGKPLEGVSVFVRDFTFQTTSDENGMVSIPGDMDEDRTLFFVHLGYREVKTSLVDISVSEFKVVMEGGLKLEEILIVGRTNDESSNILNQVHQINAQDIALFNPQTSADALAASGEVFVQKSQMGGGSPVLRGFEANKVLLVVDGVRLNNAIYRSGHLQNAITLDGSILKNISVIFGPGSLMYGSDAIGGVMHFQTRNPTLRFGEDRASANVFTRYSSANAEKTFHADLDVGNDKLASLTSVTFSDFSDLRAGRRYPELYPDYGKRFNFLEQSGNVDVLVENEDPSIQIGTAYSQLDILQKFLYQLNSDQKFVGNIQYSTSSDIPRYDALIETLDGLPRWAEWNYGPQKRLLTGLSYYDSRQSSWYDYLTATLAFQRISETRKTRRFPSLIREIQDEGVSVLSATFDLEKSMKKLKFHYGSEWNHNLVNSTAENESLIDGEINGNILTRYPSGENSMSTIAAYVSGTYKLASRHELLAGMRWTWTKLYFDYLRSDSFIWPEYFYNGIRSENNALTWSLGWKSNLMDKVNIQGMVSSAFRSPNLDDMAKIRVNNDEISAPNTALKPEKTISTDFSISWFVSPGFRWRSTVFYTRLSDAIIRSPFQLPDGSSTYAIMGDTLQVVANVNAEVAEVVGWSTGIQATLSTSIGLNASYNWTRGRIKGAEGRPLSHIPPSYGKLGITWSKAHFTSSFDVRYNFKKDISEYGDSEDNPEYATPEGSLGWATFNWYNKYKVNSTISLDLAVENITDLHYRPFASGVSAPGRNVIIKASIKI
jgi:hemoglobin/transferrin/lactoferrin receptor protein